MDTYECNVVFVNEKYGEFQYTIEGSADLPEPIKRFEGKECCVEENFDFTLELELQNRYLQNTLSLLKSEKLVRTPRRGNRASQSLDGNPERNSFTVESNRM